MSFKISPEVTVVSDDELTVTTTPSSSESDSPFGVSSDNDTAPTDHSILQYGVIVDPEEDDDDFLPRKFFLSAEERAALKKTEKNIVKPRIDKEKAVMYRAQGRSLAWIAKKFGVSEAAVSKCLTALKANHTLPAEVKDFKEARGDILAVMQKRLLDGVTDEQIMKMSVKDRVWAAAVLYDKERIERGQSTQNTAVIFNIISEACKPEI